MIKIIYISVFVMFCNQIYCQTLTTNKIITYLENNMFDIDSFKSILNIEENLVYNLNLTRNTNKDLIVWNLIEREIEFEANQFLLYYQDQDKYSNYEVSIQYLENDIQIAIIYELGLKRNKTILRKVNEEFKIFLKKYNKKYGVRLKSKNIKKNYFSLHEYGTACYVDGSITDKFFEMMKLVNDKNHKELKKWLFSLNINLRLFGVIGLKWMNKKGRKISSNEKLMIDELKKRDHLINTCSGCMSGQTNMNSIFEDDYLDSFYESYKNYGWFK